MPCDSAESTVEAPHAVRSWCTRVRDVGKVWGLGPFRVLSDDGGGVPRTRILLVAALLLGTLGCSAEPEELEPSAPLGWPLPLPVGERGVEIGTVESLPFTAGDVQRWGENLLILDQQEPVLWQLSLQDGSYVAVDLPALGKSLAVDNTTGTAVVLADSALWTLNATTLEELSQFAVDIAGGDVAAHNGQAFIAHGADDGLWALLTILDLSTGEVTSEPSVLLADGSGVAVRPSEPSLYVVNVPLSFNKVVKYGIETEPPLTYLHEVEPDADPGPCPPLWVLSSDRLLTGCGLVLGISDGSGADDLTVVGEIQVAGRIRSVATSDLLERYLVIASDENVHLFRPSDFTQTASLPWRWVGPNVLQPRIVVADDDRQRLFVIAETWGPTPSPHDFLWILDYEQLDTGP